MRAWTLTAGLLLLAGCPKHGPAPWVTQISVAGPEAKGWGPTYNPDLPALDGPKLSKGFAGRRRAWATKALIEHPMHRWVAFWPGVPLLLGFGRETLDEGVLDLDARRIEAWYASQGWLDTTVTVNLEAADTWHLRLMGKRDKGRSLAARFIVDAGERYTIDRVDIDTLVLPDGVSKRLFKALPETGDAYTTSTLEDTTDAIERALGYNGFGSPVVRVDAAVDGHNVTLTPSVEAGTASTFGEVFFEGAERMRPAGLRWCVGQSIREGQPYDQRRLNRVERRFRALPAFKDAVAYPEADGSETVPVTVVVEEEPPTTIDVAATILDRSGSLNASGGIDGTFRHLAGGPAEIHVHAEAGWRYLTTRGYETKTHGNSGPFGIGQMDLDVLVSPASSASIHGGGRLNADLWGGFNFVALTGWAGPRSRWGDLDLWGGFRAVRHEAYAWPGQLATYNGTFGDRFAPVYATQEAAVTAVYDDRTSTADPTDATHLQIDLIPWAFQPHSFSRVAVDVDRYWKLAPALTLRTRGLGGHLLHHDADHTDLIGYQFFAGGTFDLRGWGDRRLQPAGTTWDVDQVIEGGATKLGFQIEPRLRVHPNLRLAAFADTGSLWAEGQAVNLSDLRTTVGGGLFFPLTIGSGALYLGQQVGPQLQDTPDGRFRVHFQFFFGEF